METRLTSHRHLQDAYDVYIILACGSGLTQRRQLRISRSTEFRSPTPKVCFRTRSRSPSKIQTLRANNASLASVWEAPVSYLWLSGRNATTSAVCSRHVARRERNGNNMRTEYDFSKGKRGAVIPQKGKTRISIFIDNAVLDEFRIRADRSGTGYQTMMNDALRKYLSEADQPITEKTLRQVLRQEMPEYLRGLTTASTRTRAKSGTRR